jgi:hypothetical protein
VAEETARHVPAGLDAESTGSTSGSSRCAIRRTRCSPPSPRRRLQARRRTIYVFFDECASAGAAPSSSCIKRIALGGTSQGGVFEARRSTKAAASDVGTGQQAELWGDEQWQVLKSVIEERKPRAIGINRSTVFAFSDGLSSGELKGMSAALGETWTARFRMPRASARSHRVAASEEEVFYRRMQELVWSLTQTMFSNRVITPGKTRTSDLVVVAPHVNDPASAPGSSRASRSSARA